MSASRPVRIPKPSSAPAAPAMAAPAMAAPAEPVRFAPNGEALRRARRLFGVYLAALGTILLLTIALSYSGPAPAATAEPWVPPGLVALTVVLAVIGLVLTFGRTPAGIRIADEELWVRERNGRVRRFPAPPATRLAVEERYAAGFLASSPTELVRLSPPDGRPRRYVLEVGLLSGPFTPPAERA